MPPFSQLHSSTQMNDTFKSICINNQISSNEYVTLIYSSYRILYKQSHWTSNVVGQWRTMKCFLYELVEDIWELTAEVPCCCFTVHLCFWSTLGFTFRPLPCNTHYKRSCLSVCLHMWCCELIRSNPPDKKKP